MQQHESPPEGLLAEVEAIAPDTGGARALVRKTDLSLADAGE
jgi:hypothetical protein